MNTSTTPIKSTAGDYIFNNVHILRIAPRKFQVLTNRSAHGWNHYKTFSTLRDACNFISTTEINLPTWKSN